MSLVVLHHDKILTLASTQRVIAADQLGTLQSMHEQAKTLSGLLVAEESRISEAESQAHKEGHAAGFAAGQQQGLDAASQIIAQERSDLAEAQSQLQHQATMTAFDIVRTLAATLDPAELLSALAVTAARSCEPDEKLVLRVHTDHRDAVAAKLAAASTDISARFSHVLGDAGVDTRACIIESQASRVLADLETQTELLEGQLGNG